ncbi:MAG: hypothetical protein H6555_03915 [Lewinellaceae bacterium]|nr:hypothetical protein [Lewinellaceae bacterium]
MQGSFNKWTVIIWVVLFSWSCDRSARVFPPADPLLLGLGIEVASDTSGGREYSFTDKEDAYYYGRTHASSNPDYFSGWNVRTRRIFSDYQLLVNGQPLDRSKARATVYPHLLRREYPVLTEDFRLFDHQHVLSVALDAKEDVTTLAMTLLGEALSADTTEKEIFYYRHRDYPELSLGVAARIASVPVAFTQKANAVYLTSSAAGGGFLIVLDSSRAAVKIRLQEARRSEVDWAKARQDRMAGLIKGAHFFAAADSLLTQAVRWVTLTTDQLIMQQTGYGIYAGLPWFNDYWGRDIFITLPGACLATGQFTVARQILRDFAQYQNTDASSPNYGRIPNRLRPDDIIYNTTDGTPRFVLALEQYLEYTGDTTLLRELFPAVRRSIEGSLRYWVDGQGYLTHDDADTWMDARIEADLPMEEKLPWSPRGNRANDIQALWYGQLQAGARMARILGEGKLADDWRQRAGQVSARVITDFRDPRYPYLADRLFADGTPDFTMRPNQLFALDLFSTDPRFCWSVTREVWSKLVYPWGVASLSQDNSRFHPYHENPAFYHKDAAYHNGTVWVWNNGIAMQRMIEAGQVELAYELFKNMSRMAVKEGSIGGLPENTDALPLSGAKGIRFTGTFLQAWSNAEFLRVWHACFLGFQALRIPGNMIKLAPAIPAEIQTLEVHEQLRGTAITLLYSNANGVREFKYRFSEKPLEVIVEVGARELIQLRLLPGDELRLLPDGDNPVYWINDQKHDWPENPQRKQYLEEANTFFAGLEFCQPRLSPTLPALGEKDYLKKLRERETPTGR